MAIGGLGRIWHTIVLTQLHLWQNKFYAHTFKTQHDIAPALIIFASHFCLHGIWRNITKDNVAHFKILYFNQG